MLEFIPDRDDVNEARRESMRSGAASAFESMGRVSSGSQVEPHFIGDTVSPDNAPQEKPVNRYEWAQSIIDAHAGQDLADIDDISFQDNVTSAIPSAEFRSGDQPEPAGFEFQTDSPSPTNSVDFKSSQAMAAPDVSFMQASQPSEHATFNEIGQGLSSIQIEPQFPKSKPSQPIDAIRNDPPSRKSSKSSRQEKSARQRPNNFTPQPFWMAPAAPIQMEPQNGSLEGDTERVHVDFIEHQDRANQLMVSVLSAAVGGLLHVQSELESLKKIVNRSFGGA